MLDTFADRDSLRKNNFGALRLALAIFVIASHSFAAFGGVWEDKELLMRPTGQQMDLGALAVNAFFAISGYLITLSWLRTPRFKTYLMKRVLRIYPGFLVASVVCLLIVAPLAGAKFSVAFAPKEAIKSFVRLFFLSAPKAPGAFAGEPWPVLNLALWTIRYEFICYLVVPLIVLAAMRFGRAVVLALYLAFASWHASQGTYLIEDGFGLPIIGNFGIWPKFATYFLGGMVFAHYRDLIPFRRSIFLVSIAALIATAIFGGFYIIMATAGIYALFYLAYETTVPMHTIGTKWDLSYGVYLYGWPVQMLIVHHFRDSLTPWSASLVALPIVLLLAGLSWYFIEAPCLREKARLSKGPEALTLAPHPQEHKRPARTAA